jgi:hypothetical protein
MPAATPKPGPAASVVENRATDSMSWGGRPTFVSALNGGTDHSWLRKRVACPECEAICAGVERNLRWWFVNQSETCARSVTQTSSKACALFCASDLAHSGSSAIMEQCVTRDVCGDALLCAVRCARSQIDFRAAIKFVSRNRSCVGAARRTCQHSSRTRSRE